MSQEENTAPPLSPVARWVLGILAAVAVASAPALVTYGAMGARLDAVVKTQDEVKAQATKQAEKLPAMEARLDAAERRTLEHAGALTALRSDTARIAEGVAETNGILKVLLKD